MTKRVKYAMQILSPRFVPALLLAVVGFLLISVPALAQSGAGSIQGTVKDATGAVIQGAAVHVVNTATGVATDTKTNHTGFYQAPELFTGHYRMTITAPGMETYQTSIDLLVSQNAVINPKMVPGAVTQTLDVGANAVQLTTNDSPTVESTLENARIQQLPENTRDITNLLQLTTPGVVVNGIAQPSLNGGDEGSLTYVIDGASTTNNNRGGAFQPIATQIDPDAVQEVRVEASNATAQFAAPGSAVFTTKSGTNKLHGSFFETARNNAFGVDRNRDDPTTGGKPEYIRNEFGLSAGGPVYIPKIYDGRDKTFWFVAYERYSLAQNAADLIKVPTMAERHGDFSGYTNAKGVQQAILDPATTANKANCPYLTAANKGVVTASEYCRSQFDYNGVLNTIDPARESPLALIGFGIMPVPTNNANPQTATGFNFDGTSPTLQIAPSLTVRVDQAFNQSNHLYARYTQKANSVHITSTPESVAFGDIPAAAALGYKNAPNYSYNAAIGYTHIFSPSFFAETVLGADWQDLTNVTGLDPYTNYEQELGLPNNFGNVGFPAIKGLTTNLPGSQGGNQHLVQRNFNLDENLTKILGRHQILFGGRLSKDSTSFKPNGTPDSTTYTALPTATYDPKSGAKYTGFANTGAIDASFYLGSANTYVQNLSGPRLDFHQWGGSLYVQDNFHVSSRLVLNLGVRYEAHPALQTNSGLANSFDLKNDAMVLAAPTSKLIAEGYTTQSIINNDQFLGIKFETPGEAGLPANSLMNSYDWNFLPRAGFAWTLGNSSMSPVFRGGYGIYLYDTPQEDFANQWANNNPFQTTYTQSYSAAAQSIDGLPDELLRYNDPMVFGTAGCPCTDGRPGVQNAVNTTFDPTNPAATAAITPGTPTTIASASPNWMPARVQEYNATLEIPLPARSALRFSYIGSKTTDLDIVVAYNNTPSDFQWETQTGTLGPTGGASVLGTPQQDTYSTVATNPYDNSTYGQNTYRTKQGFANYNSFQMNYQRLYHSGSAFQIDYTWAKGLRAGGDVAGAGSGTVFPLANYPGQIGSAGSYSLLPDQTPLFAGVAPPAAPANLPEYETWHDMVKYQLYELDQNVPAHYVKFNGIYDIPIGRGKRFLSNTPKWLNEIIGGFQLAGTGEVRSQSFQLPDGNFGPIAPLKIYKKSKPINDCSSGVCYKTYLWYNGYIAPQQNPTDPHYMAGQQGDCAVTDTCITGLGGDYVPYQSPSHLVPSDPNYDGDLVQINLTGGATTTGAYDAGPSVASTATSPAYNSTAFYGKTFLRGPYNWVANVSVFKVFPIRQGMFLRVNLDAFNVFNMPGENNPDPATGIESYLTNAETARQLQITARFTF